MQFELKSDIIVNIPKIHDAIYLKSDIIVNIPKIYDAI